MEASAQCCQDVLAIALTLSELGCLVAFWGIWLVEGVCLLHCRLLQAIFIDTFDYRPLGKVQACGPPE